MKKYFARLDGDIVGIDRYITFFAENDNDAQEFADQKAEENYSEYEEPQDKEGNDLFCAIVEPYNPEKHDEYQGDACHIFYPA